MGNGEWVPPCSLCLCVSQDRARCPPAPEYFLEIRMNNAQSTRLGLADKPYMTTTTADSIRHQFREWVKLEANGDKLPQVMRETTLLREGAYVGRRFSLAGFHLVWLVADEQLKLYRNDGLLVETNWSLVQTSI